MLGVIVINHPLHSEPVGKHPEIRAPEGVGDRHGYVATRRKSVEQPVGFLLAVCRDRDVEKIALYAVREFRRTIAAHQHTIPHGQGDVQDFFCLVFRQRLFGRRHVAEAREGCELAAEYGLVKIERCFAGAVKIEVDVEKSHDIWVFEWKNVGKNQELGCVKPDCCRCNL